MTTPTEVLVYILKEMEFPDSKAQKIINASFTSVRRMARVTPRSLEALVSSKVIGSSDGDVLEHFCDWCCDLVALCCRDSWSLHYCCQIPGAFNRIRNSQEFRSPKLLRITPSCTKSYIRWYLASWQTAHACTKCTKLHHKRSHCLLRGCFAPQWHQTQVTQSHHHHHHHHHRSPMTMQVNATLKWHPCPAYHCHLFV